MFGSTVVATKYTKRLLAMKLWIWRRMERISWAERTANEQVLQRV